MPIIFYNLIQINLQYLNISTFNTKLILLNRDIIP